MKQLPSIERLSELFLYDSNTGIVTRKCSTSPTARQGDIVGSNCDGHLRVFIDKQGYLLHRIIWKLHTGNDPYPYEIDHINRKRDDNRISNLRLVTTQDNLKNKSLYSSNKSGYSNLFKRGNSYVVKVKRDGIGVYLGSFKSIDEALRVRDEYLNKKGTLTE